MTDADAKIMRDLHIPVNGFYFDQILAGEKVEEYRLRTPHWGARVAGKQYRHVILTRGYPKSGGVEGVTRITRPWRGYTERTITHPHFGDKPVAVYAIHVGPTS